METLDPADIRAGRIRFYAAVGAALFTGTLALVVLVVFLQVELHYLFWVRVLGLVVAALGTARGSTPVRYLLVFMVMVGMGVDYSVASGSEWRTAPLIFAGLDFAAGLALSYFALLDNKVNAWLLHQRWRYFGQRVRVADEPRQSGVQGNKETATPAPEKDELGIFEED